MELKIWVPGLLVLVYVLPPADAAALYDPQLCYLLDGFLGVYGLFITAMFVREKFYKSKKKSNEENIYAGLEGQSGGEYSELGMARNRMAQDDNATYTGLTPHTEGEYKTLPVKRERHRNKEVVYQGLSGASRDTYDTLQMQQLPAR